MDPVGLARVTRIGLLGAALAWATPSARADESDTIHINLWADRDDDDADGRPDGEQSPLSLAAFANLVVLDGRLAGATIEAVSGAEHARLVLPTGAPMAWGRAAPARTLLQGLSPGSVELVAKNGAHRVRVTVDVKGIDLRDGEGRRVDLARSQASIERTPPMRDDGGVDAPYDDFDALRVVMALPDHGPGLDGEREIAVESLSASGARIDEIPTLDSTPSRCAAPYQGVRCWASAPLRAVMDDVNRDHPLVAGR